MYLVRAIVFLLTFAVCSLAAATPGPAISIREPASSESLERRQLGIAVPASSCATEILCCNSVTYASDPSTAQLLALLGINVAGSYPIGVSCTPIAFVGVGTGSCSAQPVCCWWGAQYGYLVAIDCTPIDLDE
ncbi:hypothetical protein HYPSUDRAFT_47514 [Hypholoma sublateritium FD-334 SS-4]|uniref:Hydrophobin n=1 Tax=Hypholoma sublateritium (strain FD-334 SS-4) TaxID=945553 RepID=A0A0D2P7E8_HYPSF|nr:hypothetical protein HYPSUDRAFT_47514 [Hypholoma sublateritium FD-334 SS-4]